MPTLVLHTATTDPFFRLAEEDEAALRDAVGCSARVLRCDAVQELPSLLRGTGDDAVEALIGWPLPAPMLRRATQLRWVHLWTAGAPSSLASLPARRPGLRVTTSVGVNAESVAEHALFLALAAFRGVGPETFEAWEPASSAIGLPLNTSRVCVLGAGAGGARAGPQAGRALR